MWSDVIELTGEAVWSEGQVLLVSVECRERGDRLNLNVRRAAPYDHGEGRVVGFTADQWQVEQARPRASRQAEGPQTRRGDGATGREGDGDSANLRSAATRPNGRTSVNGSGHHAGGVAPAATAEASRPGVVPPVSGDAARLVVTIFETEDALADEALLKAVAGMLKDSPGRDAVRLVVRDTGGQDTEFDLPHASANEDLARSIRSVLRNNGSVRLTGSRVAAG